ncbi:hypothetical protein [Microvirga terrestris]|uniref:Uncharacterized protein n=1 Tax=Microvirga terrestris TaxID=2791024 RepID=A0ABS0HRV7_9HYPH|nr:hypothetical protein [Microvirga terrestris]MBF9196215.1 hypothetical protein [Microvirga terrestris]
MRVLRLQFLDRLRILSRGAPIADEEEHWDPFGESREVSGFLRDVEAGTRKDMTNAGSEKNVLADENCGDVLKRILSDGEDLLFVDDVMAHAGSSPLVVFIEVMDHGAAYLEYAG